MRILPEHAVAIVFNKGKRNKDYSRTIISEQVLNEINGRTQFLINELNDKEKNSEPEARYELWDRSLNDIISFMGVFIDAMRYANGRIKINKKPVKFLNI